MRSTLLLAGLLFAVACGEDPAAATTPLGQDRVAPTRASVEATSGLPSVAPRVSEPSVREPSVREPSPLGAEVSGAVPEIAVESPRTEASPTREVARYTRSAVDVAEAEDGSGAMVAATDPIAIDFDAHDFPPGGFDPVLRVGALRFTRYSHPRIGVLRFVLADRALLRGPVSVQVGDENTAVRAR